MTNLYTVGVAQCTAGVVDTVCTGAGHTTDECRNSVCGHPNQDGWDLAYELLKPAVLSEQYISDDSVTKSYQPIKDPNNSAFGYKYGLTVAGDDATIYNISASGFSNDGILIQGDSPTVKNCISSGNATTSGNQFRQWLTGATLTAGTLDYNNFRGDLLINGSDPGDSAHDIITDPHFTSVSNLHLQSSSPAINAGVDVGLTTDYDGNSKSGPNFDMGAYEYQDNTPPTTLASPDHGIYNTNQTVTLTCSDAGSGCSKTYYTTNGDTPTTSSAEYTSAISITSTATLKFFSTDSNGNEESVNTETYTIDKDAPTVTGVQDNHTYYTTKNPTFSEGTATLNGDPYTSGTDISEPDDYTLIVTDDADNSITLNFTIQDSKTTTDTNDIADDYQDGAIDIEGSNPTDTEEATFNVDYTFNVGNVNVFIPEGTQMTRTDGGSLDITALTSLETTATDLANLTVANVIKFGIPNLKLTFSSPITITIEVGDSYNGQTLSVYYQNEGESTWNKETTCTVASGNCTFETTHATKYAAGEEQNDEEETDLNTHKVQATSTQTTITLTWKTDHKTKATVRYGTDKNMKEKKKDNEKEKKHKLTLDNLTPDTKYYFRIKSEDGDNTDRSKIYEIKTKAKETKIGNAVHTNQQETINPSNPSTINTTTSSATPNTCTYTVESGDTLWSIAKKIYGDATEYAKIIELNKNQYPNIESKLKIGQELTFCDNSEKESADTKTPDTQDIQEEAAPQKEFHWWNPWSW
jgi:LysM repeat protein